MPPGLHQGNRSSPQRKKLVTMVWKADTTQHWTQACMSKVATLRINDLGNARRAPEVSYMIAITAQRSRMGKYLTFQPAWLRVGLSLPFPSVIPGPPSDHEVKGEHKGLNGSSYPRTAPQSVVSRDEA